MKRARALAVVVSLTWLTALVGAAGCSAILGDASYKCTVDNAAACAAGLVCDVGSGTCVTGSACSGPSDCPQTEECSVETGKCVAEPPDATIPDSGPGMGDDDASRDGGDTGGGSDGRSPADTGTDSPVGDSGPGETVPCGSGGSCPSGLFCATQDQLGGLDSQCTRTCCLTSDCNAGYVCAPVGTSASYCLPSSLVPDGAMPPSTCCSDSQCAGGYCIFESGGASGTSSFGCSQAAGSGQQGDACGDFLDPKCASAYCGAYTATDQSFCRERCCSSVGCGGADAGHLCHVESAGTGDGNGKDYVAVCYDKTQEQQDYLGLRNIGTDCTSDSTCKTGLCDDAGSGDGTAHCVDTCCIDSDCQSGWKCLPRDFDPPFLRCVPP